LTADEIVAQAPQLGLQFLDPLISDLPFSGVDLGGGVQLVLNFIDPGQGKSSKTVQVLNLVQLKHRCIYSIRYLIIPDPSEA
jgi:hypothetical protein